MKKYLSLGFTVIFVLSVVVFNTPMVFATPTTHEPNINSVKVDNKLSETVLPSSSIEINVNATTHDADNQSDWESTGWRIANTSGLFTCVNTSDLHHNTGNRNFSVTAPSTDGAYNVYVQAYAGSQSCGGYPSSQFTLSNAIIVHTPDKTPPTLHLPANITIEATSPAGATVTFSASATDTNPTSPVVSCTPSSGFTFPLKTTSVSCEATDTAGNKATGSFGVTVKDTTSPNVVISGSNPLSLVVGDSFTAPVASASDLVDIDVKTASVFSNNVDTAHHGTYHVVYHATDVSGNTGSATLTVNVEDIKIEICHKTGNSWKFMDTPDGSSLDGHLGHGDFLYTGPKNEGNDEWCNDNKPKPEVPKTATISATKIVCDNESDLPNWGAGGTDITANTATDFIAQHPTCRLMTPWTFEWIQNDNEPTTKNDDASHLAGWTTFTSSDTSVHAGKKIWVREQANAGYIPFSGLNTDQSNSAEFYCDTDVYNYDNLEWVNTVAEKTYYCIGFNVPKQCDVVSDTTNVVEEGVNSYNAVETWNHSAWYDKTILGDAAKWIWKTFKVENPTQDETKVFVKTFNLNSIPISANIEVAADNGFILTVNGATIADKIGEEKNYGSVVTYPITNLVVGTNTIRMTVKNFALADSTGESNPAGALYKLHIMGSNDCSNIEPNDECKNIEGYQSSIPKGYHKDDAGSCVQNDPEPVCDSNINLIQNGDFEQPELASGTWDVIPDSNPLLKWLVAWVGSVTDGRLGLEIQNNAAGAPYSGLQHAELDGDHPVTIWQNVSTIPGKTYKLDFAYSPRQGRDALDNEITVKVDGVSQLPVLSVDGTSNTNTVWTPETRSFVAVGSTTKIEFSDTGTDTSYGGFIDNVSLSCQPSDGPVCTESKILVDGQCIIPTPVCTNPLALNYDSEISNTEIENNSVCTYTPRGQCSDSCGLSATTVPDGQGGQISCSATNACSTPVMCEWNSQILASDSLCVAPARCQYNSDILASSPACVAPRTGGGGGGQLIHRIEQVGQVLGASTVRGLSCSIYLNKYIKYGSKNNDPVEVKKLQEFLNEYLGLKLAVSGVYDLDTYNAVKIFQVKYSKDVLHPWIPYGLTNEDVSSGTGYVYKTTKRLINLLKCPDLVLPAPSLD